MSDGYSIKEPKMKSGGMKDKAAYSEPKGGAPAARKGAPLDSKGSVSKKEMPLYKEACKDE
jgi:hypothetical protein